MTNVITLSYALRGVNLGLVTVDPSGPMLRSAYDKDRSIWPVLARAESLPLLDNFADVVACLAVFPHIHDQGAAVREFGRVLKDGGEGYVLHLKGSQEIAHHHAGVDPVKNDLLPQEPAMRAMWAEGGFEVVTLVDEVGRYYFKARRIARLKG